GCLWGELPLAHPGGRVLRKWHSPGGRVQPVAAFDLAFLEGQPDGRLALGREGQRCGPVHAIRSGIAGLVPAGRQPPHTAEAPLRGAGPGDSAGLCLWRGPPGARRATPAGQVDRYRHTTAARDWEQRLPRRACVLVTAAASRAPFGVARDRFATLDPAAAPQGFGAYEEGRGNRCSAPTYW